VKIFEEPKETASRLYRHKSDGYRDIRSEVARVREITELERGLLGYYLN
jgi:hypothetical protein